MRRERVDNDGELPNILDFGAVFYGFFRYEETFAAKG